jgi:hypothetical protein
MYARPAAHAVAPPPLASIVDPSREKRTIRADELSLDGGACCNRAPPRVPAF